MNNDYTQVHFNMSHLIITVIFENIFNLIKFFKKYIKKNTVEPGYMLS